MNILGLLKKQAPKEQVLEIIKRDRCKIRLADWRADKSLTTAAEGFLAQPAFQFMLDVVRNEHPGRVVLLHPGFDEHTKQQLRAEGYEMCLANLDALGKFVPLREPLQADYQEDK